MRRKGRCTLLSKLRIEFLKGFTFILYETTSLGHEIIVVKVAVNYPLSFAPNFDVISVPVSRLHSSLQFMCV
jgi:hypothetical protein